MKRRITAIIHTLNEELNVANALRSVSPWVDEIIVVDMYSEDRTVEIARSFGAKVFLYERMGFVEPARAFAEEQATGDWIFVLDADEIAPLELSQELVKIADNDQADICWIPRLNYFGGFPLLHSGWGPDQDLLERFYRRGIITYSPHIHTHPQPKEGCRVYAMRYRPGVAIIHFNYVNVSHWISKFDRYTDIEALQRIQQGGEVGVVDCVVRPVRVFLHRYFWKQGFRDGWDGFYYCFMMLVYRLTTAMKLRDLERVGTAQAVREKYQSIAEEHLSCYRSPSQSR